MALLLLVLTVFGGLTVPQAQAQGAPTFSKTFMPDTIGPGSITTLRFVIDNPIASPVTSLAFSDTLPAGVTIATPANASLSGCDDGASSPVLTAPDAGGTISLSGGQVGGFGTCEILVDVTSSTPGTHMNVTGDLTSSAGNSGTATDDLIVTTGVPGFSKTFSPDAITLGGKSTLTFVIDNSANAAAVTSASFTDDVPTGMEIASPANASTTCGNATLPASLTAPAGGTSFAFSHSGVAGFPTVAAGATCTVVVDILATGTGTLVNQSSDLTTTVAGVSRSAGKASAVLTVTADTLSLVKQFTNDPAAPGGTVALEFTVRNSNRDPATGVTFTDDIDAVLSGLTSTGLPLADPCGPGSSFSESGGVLTLAGGSLAAGATCSFSVSLSVPATATGKSYVNTTSAITGTVNGVPVTGSPATDTLYVEPDAPILTKEFTDDPVGAGLPVNLEFTITNPSATNTLNGIAFSDAVSDALEGLSIVSVPANGSACGAGSVFVNFAFPPVSPTYFQFDFSGGSLGPGASCVFSVDLLVPPAVSGSFVNTTSEITADSTGAGSVTGSPATDVLVVSGGSLTFTKEFTDDPAAPGAAATLEFTISNSGEGATVATDIAFTDDLGAALSGLLFSSVVSDNCGGSAAGVSTDTITYTGGTLAAGSTCTIVVTTTVPGGALPGSYTNTTSNLTATIAGVTVTRPPATDTLLVGGMAFTKEFTDDPAIPGDTVTLRFVIDNTGGSAASDIIFTDDLSAVLPGVPDLAVTGGTGAVCGGTLSAIGSSFLLFSGGSLAAATSCQFDVTMTVPAGTATGSYGNTTSNLTATYGATGIVISPASDLLEIDSAALLFAKQFTDDPVVAGNDATLEFTIENTSTQAASAIAFTDDLDAMLGGALATGALFNDCGGMAGGFPVSTFDYSGGSLAAGASCTIRITVSTPLAAASGAYPNTTSQLTGTIAGLPVTGDPASDDLQVTSATAPTFTKAFDGPSTAGGTPTLTFSITNNDTVNSVTGLSFSDNLNAVISGLAATGFPIDTCGGTPSGTSTIGYTGGSLAAGASCTIVANLQVPAMTAAGTYPNTTSDLFAGGLKVADPAIANLAIEPPPTFAKLFVPDSIASGGTSALTFTIDNTASALAASALDFTDNLPAGVTVATPANASTTCTGGTLTAVSGSGVISYTGGAAADGASCTVQADVTAVTAGAYVNTTGDLTSSSGNSGTASDTLTVNPPPGFAKVFAPSPIAAGDISTLTFTIDNTASTAAATSIDFTDNMPAEVAVATPANASTTCTGGTLTAVSGSSVVSYTGGTASAGASCAVQVDVTSLTVGSHVNTTGDLTSSLGNSGTASDTIVVTGTPVVFSKVFAPDTIQTNGLSVLTFTLDNTGSTVDATAVDFTDNMPAAIIVAPTGRTTTTCTGGTLTAVIASSAISYTGGTVPAGSTCVINVEVQGTTAGNHTNTTGDLTSNLGNSGTATDDLAVTDQPPVFSKVFTPDSILTGDIATLVFTINNGAGTTDATSLNFTDNMPAEITVATPANAATTCTGGTVTAVSGTSVITYSGGSVAIGASCTISVDVTSNTAGAHDNLTEDLTSSSGNSGKAADTLTVTDRAADLAVTLADDVDPIVSGNPLVYTATVTNNGPQDATNAVATFTLPAGVTFVSTSGCAEDPNGVPTCSLGALANGASTLVTVNVTVDAATTGVITAQADVTADETDPVPGNNSVTEDTTVNEPAADLTVTLADDVDPIVSGNPLVYTATVTNNGPQDATNAVATFTLPAGVTFVSTSGCAEDPNGVPTCSLGALANGASTVVTVNVTVDAGTTGVITAQADVAADETDPVPGNNSVTEDTTVNEPTADLSVTLADDVDPVVTGNPVVFTATVTNNGPQDATNAVATVTLPAGVTFVSTSGCAEDPNGVPTCSLGALANGANTVFTININVDVGTVGVITTQVAAAATETDPVPGNNTASETTTVDLPAGSITIVKNTAPAAAGDATFEFTSTDPDLDAISLTTIGNTATSPAFTKAAGIYTISEDIITGWVLSDLACVGDTDGGTVIDLANREAAIDLDNGETIICTFTNMRDSGAVTRQTQQAIMEFMEHRADQMTANQPDLVSRLKDRGAAATTPLSFSAYGTLSSSTSRFATSLHKAKSWRKSLDGEEAGGAPKFDIWAQGYFSHTKTDSAKSHLGMMHFGADYLINPDLVVGGIVQLDWAGLDSSTTVATVDGFGWMAGPYFVANPWQNIYIDGRLHYGQSYNDINPIGLYTDKFDTDRFLATLQVTGDLKFGQLVVNPAAELIYFNERQKSYIDTLGNTIPDQTLELGRVIFGPQFSYNVVLENGDTLTPTAKFEGIWDFHSKTTPLATGAVETVGGLRGRVDLGLGYRTSGGMSLNASGFYDGIGRSGFEAYGGAFEIVIPLQQEE